ncbi:hypothetical protein ACLOJK_020999 [Asimina triloba]
MGAELSHHSRGSYSSEPSHIQAFHSTAHWKAQFEATAQTNQLMVIDFTATWCGPCRSMEPFLEELAKTNTDVVFVEIDVDELMAAAREWSVEALPTFVLVKQGKEVDRVVGAKKDELEKKIQKHR